MDSPQSSFQFTSLDLSPTPSQSVPPSPSRLSLSLSDQPQPPVLALPPVELHLEPVQPETAGGVEPERKGRGRKRRFRDENEQQAADMRRVERNRVFAKLNRQKKKAYVFDLEKRVEELGEELAKCKLRLQQYEAMERSRYSGIVDFCRRIKADIKEFESRRLLTLINTIRSAGDVVPQNRLEDKSKALDMLAETLVEFSVPFTHRYLMCLAEQAGTENCLPQTKPQEQEARGESELGDLNGITEQIARDGKSLGLTDERRFLREVSQRMRKSVRQFRDSLEDFRDQMGKLDLYMTSRLMLHQDQNRLLNYVKWMRMVGDAKTLRELGKASEGFKNFTISVCRWPFLGEDKTKSIAGGEVFVHNENQRGVLYNKVY